MRRRKPAKPAPQVEHRVFGSGEVINRFRLSNDAGKVLTVRFDGDRARAILLLPQFWITNWAELLGAWDAAPDRVAKARKKALAAEEPESGDRFAESPETGQELEIEASAEPDESAETPEGVAA